MTTDKEHMLEAIENLPHQIREALSLPQSMRIKGEVNNIVVIGMGGSAIGGDLLASFMHNSKIPVYVNRDYNLPNFVNEKTLVFAVSYSGNTEETLSCLKQAKEKKANIIAITSGGKLAGLCGKVIKVPDGLQPRAAIGYLLFPMLGLLYNTKLVEVKNSDLNEMLETMLNIEPIKERAQKLAKKLKDKTALIYSSELLKPVALRFKTQINENSKKTAFYNAFPEMNHNEIMSFEKINHKEFAVIFIRDKEDHAHVKKRMDISRELIDEVIDVEEITTKGEALLTRIFSTILLADLTSYYLALENRIDPTPVGLIEELKRKLVE